MTKLSKPYKGDIHYAAGLRDGEKRLARALRRWMDKNLYRDITGNFALGEFQEFDDWLTARLKRGKK